MELEVNTTGIHFRPGISHEPSPGSCSLDYLRSREVWPMEVNATGIHFQPRDLSRTFSRLLLFPWLFAIS